MTRERPVRCQRFGCRRETFNDDAVCSERCSLALARVNHPTSRGTSPGFSSPAVSAPTVPAPRTARRGGSTFGDVFLSVGPSPGEQFRSDGVTPSPSEPVSHAGTAHPLRGQQSVNPSHGSAAHSRT